MVTRGGFRHLTRSSSPGRKPVSHHTSVSREHPSISREHPASNGHHRATARCYRDDAASCELAMQMQPPPQTRQALADLVHRLREATTRASHDQAPRPPRALQCPWQARTGRSRSARPPASGSSPCPAFASVHRARSHHGNCCQHANSRKPRAGRSNARRGLCVVSGRGPLPRRVPA